MATIELNNADIYYETHGDGPALVLAHGVGGNHATWYQQVEFFSRFYRVISFDHRGFGNSSDPDVLGRSRFVDDLKGLLDHLALDEVILVAQSMGGGTCIGFACEYPERVKALVLADTLVGLEEPQEIVARMAQARADTDGMTQQQRVLGPRIRSENSDKALLYAQINSFNHYNIKTVTGAFLKRYSVEQLAATGIPILFLVGTDDVLFPPDAISAVQKRIPESTFVEVADAGHSVYFENPTAFNECVLNFLQSANITR